MNHVTRYGVFLTVLVWTILPASGAPLPSQEMYEFHETAKISKLPTGSEKTDSDTTGLLIDCESGIGPIESRGTILYLRLRNFHAWNDELANVFRKLPNLRYCVVEGDAAVLEQDWIVLRSIQSLRYLKIHLRRLESIPSWFAQLKQVTGIDLSGNRLVRVPVELLTLEQLQELDLSENEIRVLEHSLEGMTSLRRLNLSHNSIVGISDKITSPPSLRELELDSNKLAIFPVQFASGESLERLHIENNYFDEMPLEWLSKSAIRNLTISRFVQRAEEIKKLRPDIRLGLVGE